jgi:hypothetical protein
MKPRTFLRIIFPLAFALRASTVFADWSDDLRVTTDTSSSRTETDGGRNVLVDDGFVMVVWSDDRDGNHEIYFRERFDDIWSAPERLTTQTAGSTHPAIGRLPGEVRVVFEDERSGHPEIWTKRRILGAWGPDSCVTCDEFESARPALDRLGVHLVWEETKDHNREIYYRGRSTGGVWGPEFRVSDDPGQSSHPSVARPTDLDSRLGLPDLVLVVWQDDRNGNLEIYSRLFEDFVGWTSETRVTDDSAHSKFPSAAVEWGGCSDLVFPANRVVWQDDRDGNDEIYFAEGAFGAWSIEHRITTSDTPSRHPSLFSSYHVAQGPFGLVWCTFPAIAWEEQSETGAPESIRYVDLGSQDAETSISETGAEGANPSLALEHVQVSGGDAVRHAVVVWEDARDGNLEIYFTESETDITITGIAPIAEPGGSLRLGASRPNPFCESTSFVVRLGTEAVIDVRVVDAAGREVSRLFRGRRPPGAHTFSWNGETAAGGPAAAGSYFLVVSGEGQRLTRRLVRLH